MSKKKLSLVYLGGALAAALYICQEFMFDGAGNTKESKAYAYSFQLNYWADNLHDKFIRVRESGSASQLIIGDQQVKVNKEFFVNLHSYHREMKDILRVLQYQYQIPMNIVTDIKEMSKYGFHTSDDVESFGDEWEKLEVLLNEHAQREKALEEYYPKLIELFSFDYEQMTDDEKVDITVKQITVLKELYSSELLFLKYNSDLFEFVRKLAEQSHYFLNIYEQVLERYNSKVGSLESLKLIVMSLLTLLSIVIGVRLEREG
ncbi:TPA: hypothetical protein AB5E47_003592 [Vibrio cholerae]